MRHFNPDIIFLSAGFDAKKGDFKVERHNQGLIEHDYYAMAVQIRQLAGALCEGRIVSVLEGGYGDSVTEPTLGKCCRAHVRGLIHPTPIAAVHVSKR